MSSPFSPSFDKGQAGRELSSVYVVADFDGISGPFEIFGRDFIPLSSQASNPFQLHTFSFKKEEEKAQLSCLENIGTLFLHK